jgi:carboxyvinyl-carboxyphosphonate phosphorylmutase
MGNGQTAFERILQEARCSSPAPVFDPISARIASEVGFDVALLAGSSVSLQVLGAPDLVLVTLTELAEQVRRIARAADIPLLVDADHGFGNALSVMRTVTDLSQAGAAAVTIEDTLLPAAFGSADTRQVIPIDEAVGKIRAACHAGQSAPIAVVARTDIAATGLENGVARIKAYSLEPVSAVFVSGVKSRRDLDAISAATGLPLILGAIPEDMKDLDYLAARRVRLFNQGHQPLLASIQATYDAMEALKTGVSPDRPLRLAPAHLVDRLSDGETYRGWTEAFLGPDK